MRSFAIKLYLKACKIHIDWSARVNTIQVGRKTRIWAFTNIMKNVVIGSNCNICDRCFVESGVSIGNEVTIKTGKFGCIEISDNVFIGPGVQFCNDKYPRNKTYQAMSTKLMQNCSIGAGSVVLPGVTIGMDSIVGAGSVVTKDVPSRAVVVGNPAKVLRMI